MEQHHISVMISEEKLKRECVNWQPRSAVILQGKP